MIEHMWHDALRMGQFRGYIVFVSTHGGSRNGKDHILFPEKDGVVQYIEVDELQEAISTNPALHGKPFMLAVEACRGDKAEPDRRREKRAERPMKFDVKLPENVKVGPIFIYHWKASHSVSEKLRLCRRYLRNFGAIFTNIVKNSPWWYLAGAVLPSVCLRELTLEATMS